MAGISAPLQQDIPEQAIHPSPIENHSRRNQLRLVFWESTSGCNLECIHCRRLDVAVELAKQDMTTEQGMAFIDSLASFAKPILVFSGGEPLFRRYFFLGKLMPEAKA